MWSRKYERVNMSEKTKFEQVFDALHLVAKFASFAGIMITLVLKVRMLLGLTNDLPKKKKDFLDAK